MCVGQQLFHAAICGRASTRKRSSKDTTADKTSSNFQESRIIIEALKGQTIHVPNLYSILKGWPVKANVNYERLVPVVEDAFDRQVRSNSPKLREKYRRADYARFVSLYYPHPEWDRIQTLALYIIWLFCWDDAIDQQGTGDLSNDLLRAKTRRDNTIRVFEHVLGLDPNSDPYIQFSQSDYELKAIGDELKEAYTQEQRQAFIKQMRRYIANCHEEQKMRLQGILPGIESYSELRHGTAAVWTLCALVEFGLSEKIPEHVRYMEQIHTIWAETSRAVWITNDILSLRKEMPKEGNESVVNAIPIIMKQEGKCPQQAVDALLAELATSVATFETAATCLEEAAGEGARALMKTYCDACRCMVTGSIQFSQLIHFGRFESSRYNLEGCLNNDGSLDILL
ncbi:terpenoid synthase [Colletotrichum zoysiae]|uniref:Terpene synthase n=1 Tax=Colletotrichum zoysiae TaxID=1216348 RepID=A0AAD9H3I2_9PEZI|nr:terpenoid synthase [Colletotrichum zoysiae]